MKPALSLLGTTIVCGLFCASLRAQTPASNPQQTPAPILPMQNPTTPPGPVPIGEEPHHRLLMQNDFVHVYTVMVPPLDATLLHQHDLPYLYIVLGPADVINAVVGKPEVHQIMQDGDTHYSPGHFAHIARTDSGIAFRNITIELVRPQGTLKNLCKEVLPGAPLDCPEQKAAAEPKAEPDPKPARGKRPVSRATPRSGAPQSVEPSNDVPYFETDELRVDLHKVSSGDDYVDTAAKTDALLVALTDANLDANIAGEHLQFLHGGDALWLSAGKHRRIVDFLGTHSAFLLISFKDSGAAPATQ